MRTKLKTRHITKCIAAFVLTLCMALGNIPVLSTTDVKADSQPTVGTPELGIGSIKSPKIPMSSSDAWTGNYVYFGKYNGTPVKYRVLSPDTTMFSEGNSEAEKAHTMFLDCDGVLFEDAFRDEWDANNANEWSASDLYKVLNNTGDDTSFINKAFSKTERSTLAESYISSHNRGREVQTYIKNNFKPYVALTGEKIFLLDVEDASNPVFGYHKENSNIHIKNYAYEPNNGIYTSNIGKPTHYFLRSAGSEYSYFVGCAYAGGNLGTTSSATQIGVSPAFNLNHSSIIFSSLIKENDSSPVAGQDGAEYKLTVLDSGMAVSVWRKTIDHNAVTLTFTFSKSGNTTSQPEKLSVVVTDGTWTKGKGWSEGATVKQYAKAADITTNGSVISGIASFTLDDTLDVADWGTAYNVYVVAEDVNGALETDYASEPVMISAPGEDISWSGVIMVPENPKIDIDDDVVLTGDVDLTLADDSIIIINGEIKSSGSGEYTLRINGQQNNTGKLRVDDIVANSIIVDGGVIDVDYIEALNGELIISGGSVTSSDSQSVLTSDEGGPYNIWRRCKI